MLRIGQIGYGVWGSRVASAIGRSRCCELVAAWDIDPVATQGVACATASLDSLWRQSDAVVVSVPLQSVAPLVLEALRRGKHVIAAKPLAAASAACMEIHRAAREAGCTVMVDYVSCYLGDAPFFCAAARHANGISAVRSADRPRHGGAGALWDLAVHDLAILRMASGEVPRVTAATLSHDQADIRGDWLATGTFRIKATYGPRERRWRARAKHGALAESDQQQDAPEPLQSMLDTFARSVRDGTMPLTDAAFAADVAAAAEKAEEVAP